MNKGEVTGVAWLTACLVFAALANFYSSEIAYLTLILFSVALIVSKKQDPPAIRKPDLLIALIAPLVAQIPFHPLIMRSAPSAMLSVFMIAAALVEELFYRGVLLLDLGNVMQAFVFALCHMRLGDPASLVGSALLVPHYLLLGFTLGLLAERGGWPLSFVAHSVYNFSSLHYVLPFEIGAIAGLVLGDGIMTALTAFYFWAINSYTSVNVPRLLKE
ncbi:MAG: CPBP family glutamic-type intramembrane protease [Thermofilaceae archaeon]